MRLFGRKTPKDRDEGMPAPRMPAARMPAARMMEPYGRTATKMDRRPRDPFARLISMLMVATMAFLAINWALDRATANPDSVIVRGVMRGSGYLLAPWRNIVSGQTLGLTTIIAGAAYFLAGILVTAFIHWTWNKAIVRRRGMRTA